MSAEIPQEESVDLPEKLTEAPIPEHLEEVSTQERIELVKGDQIRSNGQIIIAIILIGFALITVGYHFFFGEDAEFNQYFVYGMVGLVFAGIGAAFAIFGLGRTVSRRSK